MYIEHELFARYKGHIISYYHHFIDSETGAGQIKSLAKMSQPASNPALYVLFNVQASFQGQGSISQVEKGKNYYCYS